MNHAALETTDQPNDHIDHEIPGILRACALGCAIGVAFVFVSVSGAVYLSQHDLAAALALGGMSAIWGGLGFGAMLGGTTYVVRHSDESYSSPNVPESEIASRELDIVEVPSAGRAQVAEGTTSEDPRSVAGSSQVA